MGAHSVKLMNFLVSTNDGYNNYTDSQEKNTKFERRNVLD